MGWVSYYFPNLDHDAGSGDDTAKNQDLKDISVDKREASLMGQKLSSVFSPCKRFYIFQLCADFSNSVLIFSNSVLISDFSNYVLIFSNSVLMMTKEKDLSVRRTTADSSRLPALMTADHINNTQYTHDHDDGDDMVVMMVVVMMMIMRMMMVMMVTTIIGEKKDEDDDQRWG